jgi:mannose-6-phosphate isomerase-like protein (cupin superfamily)
MPSTTPRAPPPTPRDPRRIENRVQGDAVTFLETSEETGGERTLIGLDAAPGGGTTPHYHLTYSEVFRLREGRLTVDIDGSQHELGPGDEALAPAGSLHCWRNLGSERCVAQVELRPGRAGFERALRVGYALANEAGCSRTARPATRCIRP